MRLEILDTTTEEYVDITPYIKFGGVKWQRNDVDGPNAGRNINGLMIRDRVATKMRLDITCTHLTSSTLSTILNLIYPEFITVRYTDPQKGLTTATMYSNNNPASYCLYKDSNAEYWSDISFPLIER